jgi:arsenite methyltransferase
VKAGPSETSAPSCCGPGDARTTRAQVRDRYSTLAGAARSCCGADEESLAYVRALYSDEEIALLPPEVRDLAMGCGNPVALANLQPGMTVIDLGSGGGIDALLAALRVGPSGRVIGVDMTPAMITQAEESAARSGLSNLEFRLGVIEELPVEDELADVVISNCVINLSPEKDRVFREAYRVLRPGGMLAVSDVVVMRPLPPFVTADPAAWSSCVSGAVPLDEYTGLMVQAGFMEPVVRELETYAARQVAAFKEVDVELFGSEAVLSPEEIAALDGCLASARIQALKVQTCCC